MAEPLDALVAGGGDAADRCFAMAQCLSGGIGWRDAAVKLGGTFGGFAAVTGLIAAKEE